MRELDKFVGTDRAAVGSQPLIEIPIVLISLAAKIRFGLSMVGVPEVREPDILA